MEKENKRKAIKELQCLYAWAEFYSDNKAYDNHAKCQTQIEDHKAKYDLY